MGGVEEQRGQALSEVGLLVVVVVLVAVVGVTTFGTQSRSSGPRK